MTKMRPTQKHGGAFLGGYLYAKGYDAAEISYSSIDTEGYREFVSDDEGYRLVHEGKPVLTDVKPWNDSEVESVVIMVMSGGIRALSGRSDDIKWRTTDGRHEAVNGEWMARNG